MDELCNSFLNMVEGKMNEVKTAEALLITEEKKDEANMERVRYNIYEVFTTICKAMRKTSKDKESFCQRFLEKFDTIPSNWIDRLELAKKHEDAETILVEEIKLKVASELKNLFVNLSCEGSVS